MCLQVYLLPVIIQRRLGAEVPGLVDVLELPEDIYAGKYIHDDAHKSQLNTDTLSTQHIHKQCKNVAAMWGHVAGILT